MVSISSHRRLLITISFVISLGGDNLGWGMFPTWMSETCEL